VKHQCQQPPDWRTAFVERFAPLTAVAPPDEAGIRRSKPYQRSEQDPIMPEVSRFFGIVITMYYDEHNPPHFHARYGKDRAAIEIETLRVREGKLPPRALGLVVEWASDHQEELMADWEATRRDTPPARIAPLR
jgi:phosphomannomutase